MDVSLNASEKLAMEDNRYPCHACTSSTTRVAHVLIKFTMDINKFKNYLFETKLDTIKNLRSLSV